MDCCSAIWGETARSSPDGIAGVLGVVTDDERVVLESTRRWHGRGERGWIAQRAGEEMGI